MYEPMHSYKGKTVLKWRQMSVMASQITNNWTACVLITNKTPKDRITVAPFTNMV